MALHFEVGISYDSDWKLAERIILEILRTKTEQEINAILSATEKEADEVLDYYKDKLLHDEWEVDTELDRAEIKAIVFKNGNEEFVVNLLCSPNSIMITLALRTIDI